MLGTAACSFIATVREIKIKIGRAKGSGVEHIIFSICSKSLGYGSDLLLILSSPEKSLTVLIVLIGI